jgi:DNA modification methylase
VTQQDILLMPLQKQVKVLQCLVLEERMAKKLDVDVIYNQDCLEGMKNLPDKCIDLVVTDPPYLIETKGGGIFNKESDQYLGGTQYISELEEMKNGFSENILDELCRV